MSKSQKTALALIKPAKPKAPANALVIPTHAVAKVQGDPAFADLRRHYSAFKCGTVLLLGAGVAMGAEIARLRSVLHPKKGRPKKNSNSVAIFSEKPWREVIEIHSGVSHTHADRCEKVASDLLVSLDGKRDEVSVRARYLLTHPEEIATFADYETLSKVVGRKYDADTWHGILVEAGIIRKPVEGGGKPKPKKNRKLTLTEEARVIATAWLESLREPRLDRERWRKRLAALPLNPNGEDDTPSLADLQHELKDQLIEIEEIILRKQSAS